MAGQLVSLIVGIVVLTVVAGMVLVPDANAMIVILSASDGRYAITYLPRLPSGINDPRSKSMAADPYEADAREVLYHAQVA
ncbi:MAG: hypothetical protein QHH07_10395 [Sedimentisphaerales bacterium]|jgi:hypothetical protein|nr:hypothetical protein [Sedimentisphaerales bacterium]